MVHWLRSGCFVCWSVRPDETRQQTHSLNMSSAYLSAATLAGRTSKAKDTISSRLAPPPLSTTSPSGSGEPLLPLESFFFSFKMSFVEKRLHTDKDEKQSGTKRNDGMKDTPPQPRLPPTTTHTVPKEIPSYMSSQGTNSFFSSVSLMGAAVFPHPVSPHTEWDALRC